MSVPVCRYCGSPMDDVVSDEYVELFECPECSVLLSHSNESDDYTWYKPQPPDKWQTQRIQENQVE